MLALVSFCLAVHKIGQHLQYASAVFIPCCMIGGKGNNEAIVDFGIMLSDQEYPPAPGREKRPEVNHKWCQRQSVASGTLGFKGDESWGQARWRELLQEERSHKFCLSQRCLAHTKKCDLQSDPRGSKARGQRSVHLELGGMGCHGCLCMEKTTLRGPARTSKG